MINTRALIDDEIHPESEFERQYSETTVTAETFPALKNDLYIKAKDVDISGAEQEVVYKLYNDNDELLQVENVPVVKDGTSIDTVKEYYLRTTTSITPSKASTEWTETVPAFTGENKYLWNYEVLTDTRGNIITSTNPVILDQTGKQIESIAEQYAVTTTTAQPSENEWKNTMQTLTAEKKYLWNREKIKYVNIATEETTICAIIGVYGDTGETGEQGGSYKGTEEPETPVKNDFYLDVENEIIKVWNDNSHTWDNEDLGTTPSWRWNAAVQDCIANVTQDSGNLYEAANFFCNKIVANTILANKIKATEGFFDSIEVSGESKLNGDFINGTISAYKANFTQWTYTGKPINSDRWETISMHTDTQGRRRVEGFLNYYTTDLILSPTVFIHLDEEFEPYIDVNSLVHYDKNYTATYSGLIPIGDLRNKLIINNLPTTLEDIQKLEKNQIYVEDGFLKIFNY